MSEIGMQPRPTDKPAQEPASAPGLETPEEAATSKANLAAPEAAADQAGDTQWTSATEDEWSEHSATAWALAHVIHHIHSTPLPPFLLPEQRRHFHKIIQMAAEMMEAWQRGEREQAQQLASARPVTELPAELNEADQQLSQQWPLDESVLAAQKALLFYQRTEPEAAEASADKHQADASDHLYEI